MIWHLRFDYAQRPEPVEGALATCHCFFYKRQLRAATESHRNMIDGHRHGAYT